MSEKKLVPYKMRISPTPKTWLIRKAVLDTEYSYDFTTERSVRQFKNYNKDGKFLRRSTKNGISNVIKFIKLKRESGSAFILGLEQTRKSRNEHTIQIVPSSPLKRSSSSANMSQNRMFLTRQYTNKSSAQKPGILRSQSSMKSNTSSSKIKKSISFSRKNTIHNIDKVSDSEVKPEPTINKVGGFRRSIVAVFPNSGISRNMDILKRKTMPMYENFYHKI